MQKTRSIILLSAFILSGSCLTAAFADDTSTGSAASGGDAQPAGQDGAQSGRRWSSGAGAGAGGGGRRGFARRGGWAGGKGGMQGAGQGADSQGAGMQDGGQGAPGGQGGWRGLGGGMGKGGRGGGEAKMAGLRDIQQIPSLTQQQKDKIQGIYQDLAQDIKTERQQMRSMRGGGGFRKGDGGEAAGSGQTTGSGKGKESAPKAGSGAAVAQGNDNQQDFAKLKELKQSIKQKRDAAWSKVQAELTPDQLKQLDEIKNGQQPPSNVTMTDGDDVGQPGPQK